MRRTWKAGPESVIEEAVQVQVRMAERDFYFIAVALKLLHLKTGSFPITRPQTGS